MLSLHVDFSIFIALSHSSYHILPFVKVIAATVLSDPEKYCEAFLGKPNEDYSAWILDPEKWGGEFICFFFNYLFKLQYREKSNVSHLDE